MFACTHVATAPVTYGLLVLAIGACAAPLLHAYRTCVHLVLAKRRDAPRMPRLHVWYTHTDQDRSDNMVLWRHPQHDLFRPLIHHQHSSKTACCVCRACSLSCVSGVLSGVLVQLHLLVHTGTGMVVIAAVFPLPGLVLEIGCMWQCRGCDKSRPGLSLGFGGNAQACLIKYVCDVNRSEGWSWHAPTWVLLAVSSCGGAVTLDLPRAWQASCGHILLPCVTCCAAGAVA